MVNEFKKWILENQEEYGENFILQGMDGTIKFIKGKDILDYIKKNKVKIKRADYIEGDWIVYSMEQHKTFIVSLA